MPPTDLLVTITDKLDRILARLDAPPPELLDARAVAELLACSPRHAIRLADTGAMPPHVKVGHLTRWRRSEILDWVAAGCPACEGVAT